jgi:hypothetical protein
MDASERSEELKQAIGKAGTAVYDAGVLAAQCGKPAIADILGEAVAKMTRALTLVDPQLRVFSTEGQAAPPDELPLAIVDATSEAMTAGDMAKRYGYIAAAGILEETSAALVSALALAVSTGDPCTPTDT